MPAGGGLQRHAGSLARADENAARASLRRIQSAATEDPAAQVGAAQAVRAWQPARAHPVAAVDAQMGSTDAAAAWAQGWRVPAPLDAGGSPKKAGTTGHLGALPVWLSTCM